MNKDVISDIGILIVRVVLGVIMSAHGMQKLFAAFEGPGVAGFSEGLKNMGFTQPVLLAWTVAAIEFFGGIFIALGILPRTASALIAAVMLVAITKVHGAKGLFAAGGGFEYPLLILAVCLSLIFIGAGRISLFNKL